MAAPDATLLLESLGVEEAVDGADAEEVLDHGEEVDESPHAALVVEPLLEVVHALLPELAARLGEEGGEALLKHLFDLREHALAEHLPDRVVVELADGDDLEFEEGRLGGVAVDRDDLGAVQGEVERVAPARGEGQAHVLVGDLEHLHVRGGVLPRLAVEERRREERRRLDLLLDLHSQELGLGLLAPDPEVPRGAEVGHVGDGALRVVLVEAVQMVVQVVPPLGPNVNVVCETAPILRHHRVTSPHSLLRSSFPGRSHLGGVPRQAVPSQCLPAHFQHSFTRESSQCADTSLGTRGRKRPSGSRQRRAGALPVSKMERQKKRRFQFIWRRGRSYLEETKKSATPRSPSSLR